MARALLDRNRAREARRQGRLLDKLGRQFRPIVERELTSAMLTMVDHWEQTFHVDVPRGFHDRLRVLYLQMANASIRVFAARILEQGKAAGLILEHKFINFGELMTRLAVQFISMEAVRRRIQGVLETTRRQIYTAVQKGYENGKTVREVASDIRTVVPAIARVRAHTIARTETHAAANFGSNEAAKATGLPLRREWLAAHDMRTRTVDPLIGDPDEYGHLQADGQIVGPDQPFLVPKRGGGVEPLMYPGDPKGSPGNTVNCRCTLGYIVDDGLDEEPMSDAGLVEVTVPSQAR